MKPEAQVWAEELAAQLEGKNPAPPLEFYVNKDIGGTTEFVITDVKWENGVVRVRLEVF